MLLSIKTTSPVPPSVQICSDKGYSTVYKDLMSSLITWMQLLVWASSSSGCLIPRCEATMGGWTLGLWKRIQQIRSGRCWRWPVGLEGSALVACGWRICRSSPLLCRSVKGRREERRGLLLDSIEKLAECMRENSLMSQATCTLICPVKGGFYKKRLEGEYSGWNDVPIGSFEGALLTPGLCTHSWVATVWDESNYTPLKTSTHIHYKHSEGGSAHRVGGFDANTWNDS